MKRPEHKAFTLIELLVVIAIIAILAAILFPVFASARDKGRQAACASNEKQIGTAMMMYNQDYDESYPYEYWNGTAWLPYSDGSFATETYPYLKSTNIWHCPTSPETPGLSTYWATSPGGSQNQHSDYCLNMFITNYNNTQAPLTDPQIPNPSGTIAIAENTRSGYASWIVNGWGNIWYTPANSSCVWASYNCERQGWPHSNGANYMFCDGHVKYLPSAIGGANSDQCAQLWGRASAANPVWVYN